MSPKLVLHVDGATLTIEAEGAASGTAASGLNEAAYAAADWQRWARLATCVFSCMATTPRQQANAAAAEKGGAHQTPPSAR